jgi:hypothetical protein
MVVTGICAACVSGGGLHRQGRTPAGPCPGFVWVGGERARGRLAGEGRKRSIRTQAVSWFKARRKCISVTSSHLEVGTKL